MRRSIFILGLVAMPAVSHGASLFASPQPAAPVAAPAVARAPITQEADRGMACRTAVRAAERGSSIPNQLLSAISRIESGRRVATTGEMHPWPWTINAEGRGFFFETKAEAIAAVRAMQANGVRSIDIGCMQINLLHHPKAFESLEEGFDPVINTRYAATFLSQLRNSAADWTQAVGFYHSRTPERAQNYRNAVLSVWESEKRLADAVTLAEQGTPRDQLNQIFASRTTSATTAVSLPGGAGLSNMPTIGSRASGGLDSYRANPVATTARAPAPPTPQPVRQQVAQAQPTTAQGLFSNRVSGPLIAGLPVRR